MSVENMLPKSRDTKALPLNEVTKLLTSDASEKNSDNDLSGNFLISDAIDAMGFGCFQVRMILIMGIFTAADALEMILLSILGPTLRCEWYLEAFNVALLTTVVFLGMMIGAPTWGVLADKFGRKPMAIISLGALFYYGMLTAMSPTYVWIIINRGIIGVALSCGSATFALLSEYLPSKHRAKGLLIGNVFWATGSTFEVVLAYLVVPTLGWRWLIALSAVPTLVVLIFSFLIPESARYYVTIGQPHEAKALLNLVARSNGRPLITGTPVSSTESVVTRKWHETISDVFRMGHLSKTLSMFVCWVVVAFSYYGVVLLSTDIFNLHTECYSSDTTDTHGHLLHPNASRNDNSCCKLLTRADYFDIIIATMGEFAIIPINFLLIDTIGRKATLAIYYVITAVSFCVLYVCLPSSVLTAVLFIVRGACSGSFSVLYIFTAETFPTTVRSFCIGMCSAMARIGCMVTPFVVQFVIPQVSLLGGFLAYSILNVLALILLVSFTDETNGKQLSDFIEHNPEVGKKDTDLSMTEINDAKTK